MNGTILLCRQRFEGTLGIFLPGVLGVRGQNYDSKSGDKQFAYQLSPGTALPCTFSSILDGFYEASSHSDLLNTVI